MLWWSFCRRLQRLLQLNIRPTIHEVFPGNVLSGKMTIRETTFREKNHPGNDHIPLKSLLFIPPDFQAP